VGDLCCKFVSDFIRRAQHADAPTARRAKTVSHSNVGAEHCSALIDQRDRLRFSGLDAPGAKNDSVPFISHVESRGFRTAGLSCFALMCFIRDVICIWLRDAERRSASWSGSDHSASLANSAGLASQPILLTSEGWRSSRKYPLFL